MFGGWTAFAHPEHIDSLVQAFEELEQAVTSLNPVDWQKGNTAFELTQAGNSGGGVAVASLGVLFAF